MQVIPGHAKAAFVEKLNAILVAERSPEDLIAQRPLPELYVDHLLAQAGTSESQKKPFTVKRSGLFVENYSLTFFSNSRLQYLSAQLGNDKVRELVQRISSVIAYRLRRHEKVSSGSLGATKEESSDRCTDTTEIDTNIKLYFECVHPIYPFLDRKAFESKASSSNIGDILAQNKAWSALYYTVLALGCQAGGDGSFEPGKGRAWRFFSRSLAIFPELLALPDSLDVLQAMTSMAIYSLGISCLAIEHFIISEAARRAQNLGNVNQRGSAIASYHRTFWVLYALEKISSFYFGRNSVFLDSDIVCPVPAVPEAMLGDLNWFLIVARHARLLSKAMASLFSNSGVYNPKTYYLNAIDQLEIELEQWRLSIPANLRPGDPFRTHAMQSTLLRPVTLWLHFLHNSFKLSLSLATLHLAANTNSIVTPARHAECTRIIMESSRSTLELTAFIDVEPNTPLWFIAGIPITSLFVLFDLVIKNPRHPGAKQNLALLDTAGGHFSRIEYASGGYLPGSLICEFAHIAREYVNAKNENASNSLRSPPSASSKLPAGTLNMADQTNLATDSENTLLTVRHSQPDFNSSQMSVDSGLELPQYGDALFFPIGDNSFGMDEGLLAGTDIMDLFNSSIPGIDPIFFNDLG
ncbi:hypothetical protein F5B20DRAFT_595662 [Whalleya microplaca]|nr:hypothetical protein F5B20DRAFT_595662 [Whalleya microplaca]